MRWIVDAMNVIGSRPDGWWRDRPGAMRALAARLEAFAAAGEEAVTVVFDGRPVDLPLAAGTPVRALFAPRRGRDAADDEIVRLLREEGGEGVRVVTSDAALADRARAAGAEVLGARAFRRLIEDAGAPER